jgi:hypothetical protein
MEPVFNDARNNRTSTGYGIFWEEAKRDGGETLRQMINVRGERLIQLYRVCTLNEAMATYAYCVAGGRFRKLTSMKATEAVTVNQVGNNEGIRRDGVDPRLAVLQGLAKKGEKVSLTAPAREVVEFSAKEATQFNNCAILVQVNGNFLTKGSNLVFEGGGGFVMQIGTPLFSVKLTRLNGDPFQHAAATPLPPERADSEFGGDHINWT